MWTNAVKTFYEIKSDVKKKIFVKNNNSAFIAGVRNYR